MASQCSDSSSDETAGFVKIDPFPIITLTEDAVPVRCPSRFRTESDKQFIADEISKLLKAGIIEESQSPWRSQVVISTTANHKKRLSIDYASTINRFTIPDGYPIPVIDELLPRVSNWKWYSYIDLKPAYHQLSLGKAEQPLTAFEANGKLYQFTRLAFGVTNRVPAFQRTIDRIIDGLVGFVADIDDVVVGGTTKAEHDANLQAFIARAKEFGLVLNKEKCKFKTRDLNFLGHNFHKGTVSPDSSRWEPLLNFPTPSTMKELERFVGLSVYCSKWIPKFWKFAEPLFIAKRDGLLPLQKDALDCIDDIKKAVAKAILWIPDRQKPFILETDVSGTALGGVLSQEGRPVAFVSHKLSDQEKHWSAIEKEAYAIVWCTQKCRQYLLGSKFTIITDQQGVSYLFDSRPKSSIKNSKLCRWRIALSEYTFDIQYRAGRLNTVADAMSRVCAYADADLEKPFISGNIDYILSQVHDKMGHPGIVRTVGFIQRNADIPGLQSKVKQHIEKFQVCLELKPRFHSPPVYHLVTSSTPWERISIDFVGPKKPSKGGNCHFLTVVDEFSRFLFAFAMKEATTANTIKVLNQLFMLFGSPESVHSDRGSVFESHDFRSFLERWNVRKTRTTPYNPAGNGQCERVNGIIWRTVKLRLKQSSKPIVLWDEELPAALMNIRSLRSRAIGVESPHNRFLDSAGDHHSICRKNR